MVHQDFILGHQECYSKLSTKKILNHEKHKHDTILTKKKKKILPDKNFLQDQNNFLSKQIINFVQVKDKEQEVAQHELVQPTHEIMPSYHVGMLSNR